MGKRLVVAGTSEMSSDNFVKHWNHRHREDLGLKPIVTPDPLRKVWWAFHRWVHLHGITSHDHDDLGNNDGK